MEFYAKIVRLDGPIDTTTSLPIHRRHRHPKPHLFAAGGRAGGLASCTESADVTARTCRSMHTSYVTHIFGGKYLTRGRNNLGDTWRRNILPQIDQTTQPDMSGYDDIIDMQPKLNIYFIKTSKYQQTLTFSD